MSAELSITFTTALERMGPFEPNPSIAVAVSGGADSMALAIHTWAWVCQRGGRLLALVVDHGLRPESADEARITIARLAQVGIPAHLLPIANLSHGPGLAERARTMRYQVMAHACAAAGILHLLLGHHAADQVETLAMRVLRGSQNDGLAGMSILRETVGVRLLRPLLTTQPALLRNLLQASGIGWVEDPSNQDPAATRPRLRRRLISVDRQQAGLLSAMTSAGSHRCREEAATATELARRATIHPEGFAVLSPGRISAAALSRLIRTMGGNAYPPSPAQIFDLAAQPRPATVAGVRLLPAGRLGNGFLIIREEAAVSEPVPVSSGVIWDNRFRLIGSPDAFHNATIGKLGPDAVRFRGSSALPSAVLRTIPAIRIGRTLRAVPHLGYALCEKDLQIKLLFNPPGPLAGPRFVPAAQGIWEKTSFGLLLASTW